MTKRGNEELFGVLGEQKNGASSQNGNLSPQQQQQQTNNEHKKAKLENGCGDKETISGTTGGSSGGGSSGGGCLLSSRVVHVRNIGSEVNEEDLVSFGLPFGKVTNILLLKGKSQAFIEFGELIYAHNLINYYLNTGQQPLIKGKPVYIQYSNHKQLKTNKDSLQETEEEQELLNSSSFSTNGIQSGGGFNLGGSPVLRIIVDNLVYPVTLDTLYSIFARFGKVLRIVTFNKGGVFQALVEFDSSIQASQAKLALDGQQMFTSGNLLKIQFSKMQQLNVKYNNEKSRDYTNPLLPSGNSNTNPTSVYHADSQSSSPPPHLTHYGSHFNAHHESFFDPLTFAAFQSAPGMGLGTSFASLRAALGGSGSTASATGSMSSGSLSHSQSQSPHSAYNSVLLVSNLNDQMATPDALFTLFGVYGDVIRVKILFNKKDNALVQMLDPQQAQIAMTYLDKVRVFGKTIKVSPSKHTAVQMPKEGQPDSGLTKDYTNSPLHRFKKPGSKNYLNIYPPSPTLHLSNIPSSVSEDQIRDAFTREASLRIINFKFFPKDRKMALVQLETVEDAIHALIKLHNYQLSDSNHLRVSFSKSSI